MALTANDYTDPTGMAAIIITAVTPTLGVLALVLHWSTDVNNGVLIAVTALVNGAVALWAILRARKSAFAPATVERMIQSANRVRTGEHPTIDIETLPPQV